MSNYRVVEHKIPCSYIRDFPGALAGTQDELLRLAVKQYIPIDNPNPAFGDVTIIGTHANGFPKELYEPLWEDLITNARQYNFRIRSIWMADIAHDGESSVVNEDLLGNDPSWYDHPRDLMHFINLKRDEMPRPIVGIGHSMGGNNLVNLALWNPRLFSSLILIDPVLQIMSSVREPGRANIPQLSTFRRDVWPSREEGEKTFTRNPFYDKWDKRVMDRWLKYGLRDLPTVLYPEKQPSDQPPKVTLTTTVANEVHTFLRPNYEGYGSETGKPVNRRTHPDLDPGQADTFPFYRSEGHLTLARIPELRPSVLYIFGGISDTSSAEMDKFKLEQTGIGIGGSGGHAEGRVQGVTLDDVGHLIPMEASERAAAACAKWLDGENGALGRWRREEEEWKTAWSKLSLQQKQGIDERWKEAMGGDPRQKKKNKL